MQPNRLERVWEFVKPEILRRWGKLTDDDLEATEGQYDLIVEAIRKTYFEGRSHLSLEGETIPPDLERKLLNEEQILRHLLIRTK